MRESTPWTTENNPDDIRLWELADDAVAQVQTWLDTAQQIPADTSAQQLAGVLKDPNGMEFTVGFVDRVIRPEDNAAAARALKELIPLVPDFLPWHLRKAVEMGGAMAPSMPSMVIPFAQRALRSMVSHLIIDARDRKLKKGISHLEREGIGLNINLLGEEILGEQEAESRIKGTRRLIERKDIDYVSIKVSATVSPHNEWAFDEAVERIVGKLRPLYRAAMAAEPRTFINLDMEEYTDLELTITVFKRLLSEDEFKNFEGGLVLQAYLPDSFPAMIDLQHFARKRVKDGGAPIKIRVVKGANLPMEQVQARLKGWEQTVWPTKQNTDANYKALLEYALRPAHLKNIHLGIGGHNLFDVALAWNLMKTRNIKPGKEAGFEMLLGMASQQAEAVRRDVGSLLLYTPIVYPDVFDVAISYLVRRLEEGASQENFMSAVFELDDNKWLFRREEARFRASLEELKSREDYIPQPRRTQNRQTEDYTEPTPIEAFYNEPDTDPILPANREWGRAIIERMPTSELGNQTIADAHVETEDELEQIFQNAQKAAKDWHALGGEGRAKVLYRAADKLAERRDDLLEVMGTETGKTLSEGDPEVSEAIDFCHYYAKSGIEIEQFEGAEHEPVDITAVTPPWNFPVAIPCGSMAAALAAGSTVLIKPAPPSKRSAAVVVECIWAAMDELNVSRDVLQLLDLGEDELGKQFVSDPRVERLILTGGYETAELFRKFRPTLPLLAETSGKNVIIVTPSADIDLAVADVVHSAFSHAGQKCSAGSLLILVGAMAKSERFHRQLVDAASSLTVGWPSDPRTQMGPVIEEPGEKLHRGLHQLGDGESWALKPEKLDDSGRLYSPGIRVGVQPGSEYHLTEYFGPVLGVMHADTLDEAIEYVNQVDYGLTSGIHSLYDEEIHTWVEHIQAGNLYVNKAITGAIVRRQPFGGWKRSVVGAGTKAGGPNYLIGLSHWKDDGKNGIIDTHDPSQAAMVARKLTGTAAASRRGSTGLAQEYTVLTGDAANWLADAVAQDAFDIPHFSGMRDVSALEIEINGFRYRPVPVTVRATSASPMGLAEAARVVIAGLRVHEAVTTGEGTGAACPIILSVPPDTPEKFIIVMQGAQVDIVIENDEQWAKHAKAAAQNGAHAVERLRITGPNRLDVERTTYEAAKGDPDVAVYAEPVTSSGRVEMLPFVHEQAVSMTAHRFGTINDLPERSLGDFTVEGAKIGPQAMQPHHVIPFQASES